MRGRGGRGRGRGRGGRGRGRGGGGAAAINTDETTGISGEGKDKVQLDLNKDIKEFFVGTASFEQHHDAQESNRTRYAAGMAVLSQNGVKVSQSKYLDLHSASLFNFYMHANSLNNYQQSFSLMTFLFLILCTLNLHTKTPYNMTIILSDNPNIRFCRC